MRTFVALCLVALVAVPLMAGDGKKCSHSTQECLDYMAKKMADRGWVGIEYDEEKMAVSKVIAESPAEAAGFKKGDVMVAINGIAMKDENSAKLKKVSWQPGDQVTYTVVRSGTKKDLNVTLGKLPETVLAQWVGNHMVKDHVSTQVASLN
jgi:C-terminal processing protease CtpA/Prc